MARELGRAGTEVATVKLWDHINRNPGCTVGDLVKMALADMSIPVGARRMYAEHLSRACADRPARGRHPKDVDQRLAVQHVVVTRLRSMCRYGSIRRDEDGRYFTARPIRRIGIGALVQHPDEVRADMAQRNALIAFRKYRENHPDGTTYMPTGLFNALAAWDALARSEYLERQQGIASNGTTPTSG